MHIFGKLLIRTVDEWFDTLLTNLIDILYHFLGFRHIITEHILDEIFESHIHRIGIRSQYIVKVFCLQQFVEIVVELVLDPTNAQLARCGNGFGIVHVKPTKPLVAESTISRVQLNLLGHLHVIETSNFFDKMRFFRLLVFLLHFDHLLLISSTIIIHAIHNRWQEATLFFCIDTKVGGDSTVRFIKIVTELTSATNK